MRTPDNWAVVLAGGDGTRLQAFTRQLSGDERPKQFCPLLGSRTLLSATRERLALIVKPGRLLCVVTRHHEQYYRDELRDLNTACLIEQPSNRGTTLAIAAAVARCEILASEPVLGIFPADHHYTNPGRLRRVVAAAYRMARFDHRRVFLVGALADRPETEYGWIEPAEPLAVPAQVALRRHRVRQVAGFVEKPVPELAVTLMSRSCLWNTFVLVGRSSAFRNLLNLAKPGLVDTVAELDSIPDRRAAAAAMAGLYATVPASDFSRDVLAARPDRLGVIDLVGSGWTDLGQETRVLEVMSSRKWASRPPVLAAS
jgi:mannose-1-phosphate guanylyltransferase